MWTIGLLAAASALLYSAGMVLNDVFDVELDRQEQPYRPLPSGRIPLDCGPLAGLATPDPGRHAGRRRGRIAE